MELKEHVWTLEHFYDVLHISYESYEQALLWGGTLPFFLSEFKPGSSKDDCRVIAILLTKP